MTKSNSAGSELHSTGASPPLTMRRRRWLYGAVAGTATLAGLGLAWWESRSGVEETAGPVSLWNLSFDAPGKPAIQMQAFLGRPLLLNFWATWCPPCVEEFPLLDRFYQENSPKGWQVLGLAADNPSAVAAFLERVPVHFPVALAGMGGVALSKAFGNLSGGLPFTLVYGSEGKVLHRKMGRVSPQDLLEWAALT